MSCKSPPNENTKAQEQNEYLRHAEPNDAPEQEAEEEDVGGQEAEEEDVRGQEAEEEDVGGVEQLLANMELSADTMRALQEFLAEEKQRKDQLEMIEKGEVPQDFEENWNLSQFWYREDTAYCLAKEALRLAALSNPSGGAIACIASPTIYRAIAKIEDHGAKVSVFEFDSRFSVFGQDFVFYDYRNPLAVPRDLQDMYDVVIVDPPYLEEDCLTKASLTVKLVAKPDAKIILCTGKVMEQLALRLLNVKLQSFEIRHHRERLSNPFGCFANYDLDEFCKYS